MKIFHLEVQAYSTVHDTFYGRKEYFSEVYLTLDEAVKKGESWIKHTIQAYYYGMDYDYGNEEQYMFTEIEELQRMMEYLGLEYSFIIKEKDLEYAKRFQFPKQEYECRDLQPTTKEYKFNMEGKLEKTYLKYENKHTGQFHVFLSFPRR